MSAIFIAMVNISMRFLLLVLAMIGSATIQLAAQQAPIHLDKKIDLPVSHSRGLWWSAFLRSNWIFDAKLAPDKSLLIFDVDKSGRWPLIRVKDWWTDNPRTNVLETVGFGKEAADQLSTLGTEIKISPDRKYALTIARAEWSPTRKERESNSFRPGEAVLNVVDLSSWKVLSRVRTKTLGYSPINGLAFLTSKVLALETYSYQNQGSKLEFFLLSVPELKPIQRCTTQFDRDEQNKPFLKDRGCEALVAASGLGSLAAVDRLLTGYRLDGGSVVPVHNDTKSQSAAEDGSSFEMDRVNSHLSHLGKDGHQLSSRHDIPELCAGQKVVGPAFICDCRILSSSSIEDRVLASCASSHDNFFEAQVPLASWLVVFRASDLASLGSLSVSKYSDENRSVAAVIDGRLHLAQIATGDRVTVYSIH